MRPLIVATALVLGLVAASAIAHGGATTQVKTEGPYKVTWHTFAFLTDDEYARFSWEVDNASDGGDTHLASPPSAAFVYRSGDGATVGSGVEELEAEDTPATWGVTVLIPPRTARLDVTLELPEAEVPFSQEVQVVTPDDGGDDDASAGNGSSSVGAVAAALAAVAAAVLVARRR